MKKKVSGSIVTYNNCDVIYDCIKSILEHAGDVDLTLYVVDNGSTDGTVELIRDNFKQVKLIINDKNRGFGHGHNQILDKISSDYHFVINPDIVLDSSVFDELCTYLDEHSDVMMITPKVMNDDKSEQFLPKFCPSIRYVIISKFKPFRYLRKLYTRENEKLNEPTQVEFCTGCFFGMRSADLKRYNGFDTRYFMYCEDADLSRRCRKEGKIIFYPHASVIHKWKRDNTRSLKGMIRFLSSLFKYFMRWGISF